MAHILNLLRSSGNKVFAPYSQIASRILGRSNAAAHFFRVSPVGLYLDAADENVLRSAEHMATDVQVEAAALSALSHGDESGWLPSAAFALIASLLAHCNARLASTCSHAL